MTPILELRNVRKAYGDFVAVDSVSMAVPAGSIFGLLGPNGAGKTSTIRMIMNITAPDSGEVIVFGHPRTADDLRRIGYLPEERGLYRKMTVMDQLVFFGEIRGLRGPKLVADIQRWLERVDLAKWAKSKIEELSKGMQQKVQLIGTVLHTPDLLILDEPFSGLDPINQELFRELLLDYRSKGKSVVLSTHGMELAERMCDHICLISRGRAVLDGELKAIKRRIGGNAFRLVADGDLGRLQEMPEVEQALVQDGVAKLLLRPEVQGAAVLRQLVEFLNVHEFRSEEPELEQIFLKVVNDAT
ncbi:MAG TPA: ATP-binding cassette domain-containing protein [Thermoanaerobaculia bacterium]|jgi:ABC-2 type transport system ATP-binding protein|nr:ATP-binding cassette domain-containing protein [Thermoanaerobaculia bacterium]